MRCVSMNFRDGNIAWREKNKHHMGGDEMKVAFGVDIGGTKIKFGAFSQEGRLLEKWSETTDLSDLGRKILPDVSRQIREYIKIKNIREEDITGIGLGIPGPVDKTGFVKICVNLHWKEFNPVTELKHFFPNVRIAAENDANVAALGEYYRGAGRNCESMMLVTLGTGVGGGIIMNGKVICGAHGLAGEIGHIDSGMSEIEKCNCGNTGCIDQFASATGIVRIMKSLLTESGDAGENNIMTRFTARDVCMLAKKGDVLANRCIDICMGALGKGLACFSHAFDPEVFVIGGGVARAGELITNAIKRSYNEKLFLIDKGADIKLAQLGNDAGITGACMLVLNGD